MTVNPDEVVAIGAAVQAAIIKGEVKDVLLLDVTPLSLGLETMGGVMTKVIERNTTIPARRTEVFSTAEDNQTAVDVVVLQGERELAADNRQLARFRLENIRPAPRGVPQIEVTFDIDANGILNVQANDKATGKEQKIVIKASSGLNEDEIKRMVRDAESHAEEDRKFRELVESRNKADALLHQTEKALKDLGDKVQPSDRANIESAMADLKRVINDDDKNVIETKANALSQAAATIAQQAYAQAGPAGEGGGGAAGGAPGGGANAGGGKDDVVDAEFEEVKDRKNG